MRHNKTFAHFADGNSNFPTCSEFSMLLDEDLDGVMTLLNGLLHGPVHIMIGGHWGHLADWSTVGSSVSTADGFLLLSKWMWRQGFVRTPKSCSDDTEHKDCLATCPEGILGSSTDDISNSDAYDILDKAGIFTLSSTMSTLSSLMKTNGLGWKDLLKELCHVGSPGDMFSSAAPQDPTFWPLHGNAERVVQYLRVLKNRGEISFDETWSYTHTDIASNTAMICDWSEATGTLDMPTCTKGVCSGHKEDDLLPFENLLKSRGSKLYTNKEFYALINPLSEDLPYAFDSFTYWEGCTEHNLLAEYEADDDDSTDLSFWEKLFGSVWSVM